MIESKSKIYFVLNIITLPYEVFAKKLRKNIVAIIILLKRSVVLLFICIQKVTNNQIDAGILPHYNNRGTA